jgi:hypothetical protein
LLRRARIHAARAIAIVAAAAARRPRAGAIAHGVQLAPRLLWTIAAIPLAHQGTTLQVPHAHLSLSITFMK